MGGSVCHRQCLDRCQCDSELRTRSDSNNETGGRCARDWGAGLSVEGRVFGIIQLGCVGCNCSLRQGQGCVRVSFYLFRARVRV